MVITVEIPEELAQRLGADPRQLPRQALELLVEEIVRLMKDLRFGVREEFFMARAVG